MVLRNGGFLTIVGGDANLAGPGNQETRKQGNKETRKQVAKVFSTDT
jgi:hypothetical protein